MIIQSELSSVYDGLWTQRGNSSDLKKKEGFSNSMDRNSEIKIHKFTTLISFIL